MAKQEKWDHLPLVTIGLLHSFHTLSGAGAHLPFGLGGMRVVVMQVALYGSGVASGSGFGGTRVGFGGPVDPFSTPFMLVPVASALNKQFVGENVGGT